MSILSNLTEFCIKYREAALNVLGKQSSESGDIRKDSGIEFFTYCHI